MVEEFKAPPSKSVAIRAIVIKAYSNPYSNRPTKIDGLEPPLCEDIAATIKAMRQFGHEIYFKKGSLIVEGGTSPVVPEETIDMGGARTGLSFVMDYTTTLRRGDVQITGDASLCGRSIAEPIDALRQLGAKVICEDEEGYLPVTISCDGVEITGGKVKVEGKSSQTVSALIPRLALTKKGGNIYVTSKQLNSGPYVDITEDVLDRWRMEFENKDNGYKRFLVKGRQKPSPPDRFYVEGCYSSAAFILGGAAARGVKVKVTNLEYDSAQGDKAILGFLRKMGCKCKWSKGYSYLLFEPPKNKLKPLGPENFAYYPDLVLMLAMLGALADGETIFTNIGHLVDKESNRIETMAYALCDLENGSNGNFKVDVDYGDDYLKIVGNPNNKIPRELPDTIDDGGDHRIKMALWFAGVPEQYLTPDCEAKSYPTAKADVEKLEAIS